MVEALPAAAVVRSCECRGDQAEIVAAQSMQLIGELGALTTQAFQEMRKLQQRVFDLEASEQLLPVATALDEPETKSEAELALPETAPSTQRMRTSRRRRRQQRLERRPYYFLEHMLPPEAPQPVAPAATVPVAGSSAVAPGVGAEQADARRVDEVSPEPATTAAAAPITESSEAGPTADLEQAGVHRVGLLEAANAAATAKITRIQARWRCYRFRQAFILRDFEGTEFWEGGGSALRLRRQVLASGAWRPSVQRRRSDHSVQGWVRMGSGPSGAGAARRTCQECRRVFLGRRFAKRHQQCDREGGVQDMAAGSFAEGRAGIFSRLHRRPVYGKLSASVADEHPSHVRSRGGCVRRGGRRQSSTTTAFGKS